MPSYVTTIFTNSPRGLRDGIFDATLGPIWYYYNVIDSLLMKIHTLTFHKNMNDVINNEVANLGKIHSVEIKASFL